MVSTFTPTDQEIVVIDALQESGRHFQELFEHSRDGLAVVDGNKRFIEANPAFCQMLGYTIDEIKQMENIHAITPLQFQDWEKKEIWDKRLLKRGYSGIYEKEFIHKNGNLFPVELQCYAFFHEDGGLQYVWGTVRDISERKANEAELSRYREHLEEQVEIRTAELKQEIEVRSQAERALKESEEKYKFLAENSADVIYKFDLETEQFNYVSPSLEKLVGYTVEEGLSIAVSDTMTPESYISQRDQVIEAIENTELGPRIVELDAIHKDGHVLPIEAHIKLILDKKGNPVEILGVARDITTRKAAEERIKELNRLNEQLLMSGKLEDKLKLVTDRITDIFKADFTRIWLTKSGDLCDSECIHAVAGDQDDICRKRDRCLHLMSSSGRYTHIDGGHRRVPFGFYKIGRIASGKASKYVTNDVAKDPRIGDHAWAKGLGLMSFAGYRLLSDTGEPMGVLALFSKNAISPEEDALLESIASSTAQVIQAEMAREALRANEKFLDAIIENIPDMIFVKDAQDLRFARFNKAGEALLGYKKENLYGKNDYDFFPKEEADFFVQKDREVLNSGKVLDISEEKIHTKSKGERILHTKKIPILGDDQKPLYLLGISEDITEKRQAEAFQRFQSQIINQIHDSVISVDMDGMIISWNKGSENLFHYKDHEMLGKHISMLYPQHFHTYLRNNVIPTLLSVGSHGYETTLVRKGGGEFKALISLSVLKDADGNVNGMIGYTLDITEQKLAQKALADSERRLADIVDFLPDPTFAIDINGRVITWNRAIEKLSGIERKEMIGKGDYAYSIPFYGERRPILADLVLQRDEQWEQKYIMLKEINGMLIESNSFHPQMGANGRHLSSTAARLYNSSGDITGAIETVRDVTDAKRTEEEREQLIEELQEAVAKVQTLSGLLPICATCKKIRDDQGYWNHVETYITEHSKAEFSHSICPGCAKELYPELKISES